MSDYSTTFWWAGSLLRRIAVVPLSEICWGFFELLLLCSLSCLLDIVSISLQIHHSLWLYNKLCGYISLKIAIWILSPYSFFPQNYFSYFSSSTFPCKFWNNLVYIYKTLCWNFGSDSIKPGKYWHICCVESFNLWTQYASVFVFFFEHTNYTRALLKLHLNISFLLRCEFYF